MPSGIYKHKPRSEATKRKISKSLKGHIGYGKGIPRTEKVKIKMSLAQKGCKGSNWKGGYKKVGGYILCLRHDHPFCNKSGYILEHRLIMEKHIGRYLKKDEIVHHINHIRDDNRIENLKIFPNKSEHGKHHFPKKKKYIKQKF